MKDGCAFCDYEGPSPVLAEGMVLIGNEVIGMETYPYFVIEPLDPVTPGHLLVIPRAHVPDFRSHPRLLGAMMQSAADLAANGEVVGQSFTPGCNLIVSAGAAASQTVPHMHVHVVPRRDGDGLTLPWSVSSEEVSIVMGPPPEQVRFVPVPVEGPIRSTIR